MDLPLNISFGIIEFVFKEGYIHGVKNSLMLGRVALVTFLMRRIANEDAFKGFRVEFASKLLVYKNKHSTSKDFKGNMRQNLGARIGFEEGVAWCLMV